MPTTTYLPKGHHCHVSSGLKMDGTWAKTVPTPCGICRAPEVRIDRDNAHRRVESCDACGAVHVISKGTTSWWYHDWQKASEVNAPAGLPFPLKFAVVNRGQTAAQASKVYIL